MQMSQSQSDNTLAVAGADSYLGAVGSSAQRFLEAALALEGGEPARVPPSLQRSGQRPK
jgi:hypothetical protein